MFRLFSKQKTTKTDVAPGRLHLWFTEKINLFQQRWADCMQRWMERLSLRGKKVIVVVSCIVCTGYCCWIIYHSFYSKDKLFSVTPIRQPAHATETGETPVATDVIISEREYRQITAFHQYIDSLSVSIAGKQIADSILLLRPGLMDSIYQLERIYKQNEIK